MMNVQINEPNYATDTRKVQLSGASHITNQISTQKCDLCINVSRDANITTQIPYMSTAYIPPFFLVFLPTREK
jgi:hypothetical protein